MYRSLITYLLIAATLGGTLMMPLVQLDFEIRRDYIYKVLCIERDKPITVCGGSCYLTARFSDLTQQQEQTPETSTSRHVFSFFQEEIGEVTLSNVALQAADRLFVPYCSGPAAQFNTDIFRPPRLV